MKTSHQEWLETVNYWEKTRWDQISVPKTLKTNVSVGDWQRLEFQEKFVANNFALSDAEDNTFGLLNRGGIADLYLLGTILAICQKSWKPSFLEVIDSFVLLAYASLAASRTLLQWSLVFLNFDLDSEGLFC